MPRGAREAIASSVSARICTRHEEREHEADDHSIISPDLTRSDRLTLSRRCAFVAQCADRANSLARSSNLSGAGARG